MFKKYLKQGVTVAETENFKNGEPPLIARIVATALFAGYFPLAQGTVGSLWIPLLFIPYALAGYPATVVMLTAVPALAIVLYFIGVWASNVCEPFWGKDPGRIVIDEVVGMLVTISFLPLSPTVIVAGFIFFRIFDILKPPPVRNFERYKAGWGVMNDDVVAGIFANIGVRIVLFIIAAL